LKLIKEKKFPFKVIFLDKLILLFVALVLIYFFLLENSLAAKVAGLRYNTEFFILYFLVKSFNFDKNDFLKLIKYFLASGVLVVLFGLLQIFILSPKFLQFFGYSSGLAEYLRTGVLPTYELLNPAVEGIYRIQSFLPGALQFSSYLLLLTALILGFFLFSKRDRGFLGLYMFFSLVALVFTFTRSAWIGFSAALLVVLFVLIKKKRYLFLSILSLGGLGYVFFKTFSDNLKFQAIFLHGMIRDNKLFGSTFDHLEAMKDGLFLILSQPMGWGLGVSGPASKFSDKVFIPENWYLQIGTELGILGVLFFVMILSVLGWSLLNIYRKAKDDFYKYISFGLFACLIALSISSLFLHTFSDTATVYPFWIFAGLLLAQASDFDIIQTKIKEK
jgi:O-antigen ligase